MKKRETALQPLLGALDAGRGQAVDLLDLRQRRHVRPVHHLQGPARDDKALCVVEEVSDLWALDRSRLFPGRYHVLGGRLSALEGVRPEDLTIDKLVKRVSAGGIDEVVLAMNATLEGQTTAHYLAERLEGFPDPDQPVGARSSGRRGARLSRRRNACPGLSSARARARLLEPTDLKD